MNRLKTRFIFPDHLAPSELDQYLAKGWYRMGTAVFTTHFLTIEESVYSVLWLRLSLEDFTFSKRQRRLMRSNSRFKVVISPFALDTAKEQLYQRYRRQFRGLISPNLRKALYDLGSEAVFLSMECSLYDGDRLVAFSVFDLGSQAATSIIGVYDPEYSEHSLGYFTMLLEMEYALALGLEYYYPGYFVPGYSRFDYKLRIGEVEYFEPLEAKWLPIGQYEAGNLPIVIMRNQLSAVKSSLSHLYSWSMVYDYPFHEINPDWLGLERNLQLLNYPIFLSCESKAGKPGRQLIIVYDVEHRHFVLLSGVTIMERAYQGDHTWNNNSYPGVIEVREQLLETVETEDLIEAIDALIGG